MEPYKEIRENTAGITAARKPVKHPLKRLYADEEV
jgi:hypothetical protein